MLLVWIGECGWALSFDLVAWAGLAIFAFGF